jgi:hypothetical protein
VAEPSVMSDLALMDYFCISERRQGVCRHQRVFTCAIRDPGKTAIEKGLISRILDIVNEDAVKW